MSKLVYLKVGDYKQINYFQIPEGSQARASIVFSCNDIKDYVESNRYYDLTFKSGDINLYNRYYSQTFRPGDRSITLPGKVLSMINEYSALINGGSAPVGSSSIDEFFFI